MRRYCELIAALKLRTTNQKGRHLSKGSDGRRTNARSKGKVERSFLTIKCSLETLYHLQQPESLEEANAWLHKYLQEYKAMCST